MAMARTLLERLALRGLRPPSSENLPGQSPNLRAIACAPTPQSANVRKAVTKSVDVALLAAPVVAPKMSATPVSVSSPATVPTNPINRKPVRQSLLMKSPALRKKKQQASTHPPATEAAPTADQAPPPRQKGRPPVRVQAATTGEARVAVPVNRKLPFSSPLRKNAQKRKRKQATTTSPSAVEMLLQPVPPPPSQGHSPPPRQRKAPRKDVIVRPDGSPEPRLMATPQRRPSSPGSPKCLSFNSAPETCSICCDDVDATSAVRLRCNHGWYCKQCMARHVEARLDTGAVQQTCPECNVELAERDLKRLCPPELMDRLLARSLEQAVASTADLRPCPTPNCPMRVCLEPDESGQFLCTLCKKGSCLRCGVQPYHRRMTCEQYAARHRRDSFMDWMEETGAKQCPGCKMAVTKLDINQQATQKAECHKMLCRNCNTRFCFKCLAVLTDEYTCGCTKDKHGFVDPDTGKYIAHFSKKKPKSRVAINSSSNSTNGDDHSGPRDFRDRAGGA